MLYFTSKSIVKHNRKNMETATLESKNKTASILSPKALLEHWQGHRRVTRG
jgi:hypothetical protein